MDIRSYLQQQKHHIRRQSDAVRDFRVFDFAYLPDEPVMRDEARELIDAMLRFDLTGVPAHHAVIGSRGCGKTLMLKYLQQLMPEQTRLDVHYVNCRHHNTSYRILGQLLGGRYLGASLSELFQRFQSDSASRSVLVLDEIDLMSPKDKRREILYLLSRSEKPYMVVMLSNSPQLLKQLDPATHSSLQPLPLHFRHYDADQIQQILRARAETGLHRWHEPDLARIAGLTVQRANADARVAIKTLYHHVTANADSLEDCFEKARRDVVVDMINDLADANLMILWAAATSGSDLAPDIYRRYCRFSRDHHEKPFSYVHFYANLAYLQSMGLLGLVSTKQGRTYTNRVLTSFEHTVVHEIVGLRFG